MSGKSKPQGRAHRARLRALLLPRLYPGAMLPRHTWLAAYLGICSQSAGDQLVRMLAEAGVETVIRGNPRRRVVVAMPERRAAA
jgi:hypothetical protein